MLPRLVDNELFKLLTLKDGRFLSEAEDVEDFRSAKSELTTFFLGDLSFFSGDLYLF